jgi:hypothetical protein
MIKEQCPAPQFTGTFNFQPMTKRPSNILIYVVLGLTGLIGIYLLGAFLESRDWERFEQGNQPVGWITVASQR